MSTRNRWEDWTSIVAGIVLFVTPFFFNGTAITNAAWTAYVGGVLLVLVGAWNLARSSDRAGEWVEGLIGVLLILSPWVLGFTAVSAMAWSAWIIGIVAVVLTIGTPATGNVRWTAATRVFGHRESTLHTSQPRSERE